MTLDDQSYLCVEQWQPYMTNHQIMCLWKKKQKSKIKANENAKAAQFALCLHLFCFLFFFLVPLLHLWELLPVSNICCTLLGKKKQSKSENKCENYISKTHIKRATNTHSCIFLLFCLLYFCFDFVFLLHKMILAPCIYGCRARHNPRLSSWARWSWTFGDCEEQRWRPQSVSTYFLKIVQAGCRKTRCDKWTTWPSLLFFVFEHH